MSADQSPLPESDPVLNARRDFEQRETSALEPLLHNAIRILRRRVKTAVAVLVLFTVPAGIVAVMRPPVYQATARILVERNDEISSVLKEAPGGDRVDDYFQTQTQLLRSRPILAKAIGQVKLWESPQFALRQPFGASAAEIAGSGLVDRFLEHLTIAPTPGTHLLNITFEAADPAVAMNAVNALTQVYIDDQIKSQLTVSSEVVGWLNDRLSEQRTRLKTSETVQQDYMVSHDAVSVQDRQNIVVQKLSDLNAALTRAKTERMAKQAQFDQLTSVQANPSALDALPLVLSNAVLQQLRSQLAELRQKELALSQDLGDRHPDMIKIRSEIDLTSARLRGELTKLTESVRNDFRAAQAIEQGLVGALEAQKREVLDLNRKSIEYGALQRQVTSDREIYERLLGEAQTRGVTGKTSQNKIRIVEPAELPLSAIGPHNARDLLLIVAAGLFLAVGVPLTVESLDRRIKSPDEIEQHLHLSCIAMVPQVENDGSDGGLLIGTDATAYTEAFRRIRTAVRPVALRRASSRLLVTSALPKEGKSIVTANLAIALAQAGQRVLLIDGDLRRPVMHRLFGVSAVPGFSDLLSDGAETPNVIRATSTPNLFVLPCGSEHVDAAELLASPRLQTVLNGFDGRFNWVLIDSPPVGPVADACSLGRLVQFAILVVVADSTPVAAASAAVKQLGAADIKIAGAVLNRVDLERSAYYYGPYYYSQYSSYYTNRAGKRSS